MIIIPFGTATRGVGREVPLAALHEKPGGFALSPAALPVEPLYREQIKPET
jgi:hypothetical protein